MNFYQEKTAQNITVILADDHEIVRVGLKRFLSIDQSIQIIAEATNGEDAVTLTVLYRPNIVLLDINMPRMDGIRAASEIKKQAPDVKIVMLSAHEDSYHLEKALGAGANGYLSKEIEAKELLPALQAVMRGERVFSRSILQLIQRNSASIDDNSGAAVSLTKREQEILGMVVKGLTSSEIADKLSISPRTVETHRFNLITKFGVKNTAGLVRFAVLNENGS
ncbi:MAG: response regulator transcription factor [Ignavibacteriae bacterium]|nr:response regulator transcription factor [Ignavibacteriota bacterium]